LYLLYPEQQVGSAASAFGKKFTQKLLDKNGKAIAGKKVKWETKNKKIATVSKIGVVKAVSKGTTKITAKYKGKTYKFEVKVKAKINNSSKGNGFNKLKNYILNKGSKNSDGNYFIKDDFTYKGTEHTPAIIYQKNKNSFKFLYIIDDGDIYTALEFTLNNSADKTTVKFFETFEYDDTATEIRSKMDPKTFNKKTYLNFSYYYGDYISSTWIDKGSELANATMTIALIEWKDLLKKAGVTLKDIGFKSY